MRRLAIAIVALATIALGALGLASTGAGAATVHVSVVDNSFQPKQITVKQGDTVVWTDTGSNPHTVTADGGAFDSSGGGGATLSNGQSFSFTFSQPGTYAYHCKIHGAAGGIGMSGTVVVLAATAAPTATGGGSSPTGAVANTPAAPSARATTAQPHFTG